MLDPFYDPTSGIGATVVGAAAANSTSAFNTFIDATGVISIGIGVWLVVASGSGAFIGPVTPSGVIAPYAALIDELAAELIVQDLQANFAATEVVGNSDYFTWQIMTIVNARKPKTLKVSLKSRSASGSPTAGGVASRASSTGINAVRIANFLT